MGIFPEAKAKQSDLFSSFSMKAHLIILVALAVLPSVVDAGPKRPKEAKSFHRPTEYSAADWDAQQRFGNGCSGENGGRTLVEIVTDMARLVPAQQLLAHLQRLSILTISNVHRAFTLAAPRASGARTTGPPPEQKASAEALFAFLLRDAALSQMHGTSFAGPVVAAWPVVTFELLDGAKGLAAVWDLMAGSASRRALGRQWPGHVVWRTVLVPSPARQPA